MSLTTEFQWSNTDKTRIKNRQQNEEGGVYTQLSLRFCCLKEVGPDGNVRGQWNQGKAG